MACLVALVASACGSGETAESTTTSSIVFTETTTTTLAPTGPVRPRDWTLGFAAVWRFEETAGDALDDVDPMNDLTAIGGAGRDTALRIEGERSAVLSAALDQYLTCSSCAAPRDAGPTTFGCWIRPDATGGRLVDSWLNPGGVQWQLLSNGGLRCNIGDGSGTKAHNTPSGTIATGEWTHATCQSDSGAIRQFVAGSPVGADKPHGLLAPTSAPFRFSTSNKGADYSGRLDECFWSNAVLDAAQICRICSCGIDGTAGPCACDPAAPTVYLDEGRNDSMCGDCDLAALACNADLDGTTPGGGSTSTSTSSTMLPPTTTTTIPFGCSIDADCDDGLFCTGVELCLGGTCFAGAAPTCDDGVVCTVDLCDSPLEDCVNLPIDGACDDLAPCNGEEICLAGIGCIAGVPTDCDDANPCTDDSCDAVTGCMSVANASPCDDGVACTAVDTCAGGLCSGVDTCPAGSGCSQTLGVCAEGPSALWIAAAVDSSGAYTGAMTTSTLFALGDDSDPTADSLVGELVFADSLSASFSGGSGDAVVYTVDLPATGTWYLWARLYYPGDIGSNQANSFLVSVDGGQYLKLGNNRDLFQQWHWDGDGRIETGATAALPLGPLGVGAHELKIEKREVSPIQPRVDVLVLSTDPAFVPTDSAAAAALGFGP